MEPFSIHEGKAIAIYRDNIDTDIIIPKQYLKHIEKTGFGPHAFDEWRYDENRVPLPEFPLNKKENEDATILITGENFGCGSSREHAAWALQDCGFKVIIAGGYSDIFYMNWLNNGNLPIILSKNEREELIKYNGSIRVNLLTCEIEAGKVYTFDIDEIWKQRLLKGLDSIGETLQYELEIKAYESSKEEQYF